MLPDLLDIVLQYVDPKTYKTSIPLNQKYTSEKYESFKQTYRKRMGLYHWNKMSYCSSSIDDIIPIKYEILKTLNEVGEFIDSKIEVVKDGGFKRLLFTGIIGHNNFAVPQGSYTTIKEDISSRNPIYIIFETRYCNRYGTSYAHAYRVELINMMDYLWRSLCYCI